MTSNTHPPVIHNAIERDKNLRWHPCIEIRHKGVVIYSITVMAGYMQPAMASTAAMQEVKRLISG